MDNACYFSVNAQFWLFAYMFDVSTSHCRIPVQPKRENFCQTNNAYTSGASSYTHMMNLSLLNLRCALLAIGACNKICDGS